MASIFKEIEKLISPGSGRPDINNVSQQNPEQQQLFTQLMQMLSQGVEGGRIGGGFDLGQGKQFFEEQFAAPAREQFQEQTLPALLQQFASTGQSVSSPASQQVSARALADLERGLTTGAGQFAQGQQSQALKQLQGLLAATGQRTFLPTMQQPQPGFLSSLGESAGGIVGQGLGKAASSILPFLL
jgi:hypothetical protein